MKLRQLAPLAVVAAALALTACSGESGSSQAGSPAEKKPGAASEQAPGQDPAGKPKILTVSQVDGFSPFVTNEKGRTIYRFDNDSNRPPTSTCFDVCAQTWEPVLGGAGIELASRAIEGDLVGTIDRPEGKQITLNGWPLYYFKTDKKLGQTAGHGRNGTWFAVAPNGTKAQKTEGASATTTSSGYVY